MLLRNTPREITRAFEDLERMFENAWGTEPNRADLALAMDVYEKDNTLHIQASMPGMKQEDLKIMVEGDVLTISGETKQTWEHTDDTKVYRREQRFGKFTRSLRLPENLMMDKVEAKYDNGIVTVMIPKKEPMVIEPKVVPILNP